MLAIEFSQAVTTKSFVAKSINLSFRILLNVKSPELKRSGSIFFHLGVANVTKALLGFATSTLNEH